MQKSQRRTNVSYFAKMYACTVKFFKELAKQSSLKKEFDLAFLEVNIQKFDPKYYHYLISSFSMSVEAKWFV